MQQPRLLCFWLDALFRTILEARGRQMLFQPDADAVASVDAHDVFGAVELADRAQGESARTSALCPLALRGGGWPRET